MAGLRQHILPRFLLEGFASRPRGKQVYCWVFQKDKGPFETNIVNVAVQRNFYGGKQELSADNEITEFETQVVKPVKKLRQKKCSTRISGKVIPEFIAHLTARTKFIRDAALSNINCFCDWFFEQLSEPRTFHRFVLNFLSNNPKMLENDINEAFKHYPLSQAKKSQLYQLAREQLPHFLRTQQKEFGVAIKALSEMIKEQLPFIAKKSHIKSLLKGVAPQFRVEPLKTLDWYLIVSKQTNLILGDFGPLSKIEGGRYKALPDKDDKVGAVFLPISNRNLIVGIKSQEMPEINFEEVNCRISECSYEYFISSFNDSHTKEYSKSIAQKAYILSDSELQEIISEACRDLEE